MNGNCGTGLPIPAGDPKHAIPERIYPHPQSDALSSVLLVCRCAKHLKPARKR
jgi:hypothetical protein